MRDTYAIDTGRARPFALSSSPEMAEMRVHEREDARIERILALIDEAARPRPLPEVLGALCAEVAAIVDAPVASAYVRDPADDGVLVMQANEGFPGGFIGKVRLAVGEGITGFAAQCMRPVTVTVAAEDAHYKAVPGLPEAEYPVFLALPILVGHRAEAVLVLQRRAGNPFLDEEIVLATALATSVAYALERARARREEESDAPRAARLSGRALVAGSALGRVETSPTFEGLAALARARGADSLSAEVRLRRVGQMLEDLSRDLDRARQSVESALGPEERAGLMSVALLWHDGRLRELVQEKAQREGNPVVALREVARLYARAPYELEGAADPAMTERSAEIEALCLQLAARVVDERSPSTGAALLLTDRLPAVGALIAVSHRASAIAVGASLSPSAAGVAILRAARVPLVDSVPGLFAWARVGDRVLVDAGDAEVGHVEVNPSATAVARFRKGG